MAMTSTLALSSSTVPQEIAQSAVAGEIEVQQVVVHEPSLKDKLQPLPKTERQKVFMEEVQKISREEGVPHLANQIYKTVATCENIPLDPNKQSGNRYKSDHPEWGTKAGDQELSFGLAMIHLPSHPTISKAQAQDPEFAIRWMVKEFKAGRAWQWTCWDSNF